MADETETTSSLSVIKPCSLCHKDAGRYRCPRCNASYCSVACYKSEAHGDCSEAFYKSCVMSALQELKAGGQEKERMLEMLKRLEEENPTITSEDDVPEDGDDLAERLTGLNLDGDWEDVWKALSPAERSDFKQMLNDGRLGNMMTPWKPWWSEEVKSQLVTELTEDASSSTPPSPVTPSTPRTPTLLTDIPHLSKLLPKGQPAPCLEYNVVNVLYGYCYVCRLYNGEHLDHAHQTAQDLVAVSGALLRENYQSVLEAVLSCKECARRPGGALVMSGAFSVSVLEDVRSIVAAQAADHVTAALSQLHRIFKSARATVEKDLKRAKTPTHNRDGLRKDKQKLFAVQKKIEFLLSWLQTTKPCLQDILAEIEIELCAMSTDLATHDHHKHNLEKTWQGPMPPAKPSAPLIQEIS